MRLTATVVLSRQALRPCAACPWVRQSAQAIKWIKAQGLVLTTSVGMQTWELVTFLGSIHELDLEIFLPCRNEPELEGLAAHIREQFRLCNRKVRFTGVFPASCQTPTEDIRLARDREIVGRTQMVIPISVRPNGHMERLIREAEKREKPIIDKFQVDYERRREPLAYRLDKSEINPEIEGMGNQYLFHWTRTTNTPWPTETSSDFYRAITESQNYPRSAFHSLINILTAGIIRASSRNMPGNAATVSFSDRQPSDMTELMSWRSRYRVMSFEPYAVGIDRSAAADLNILPVIYYDRTSGRSAKSFDVTDRWRTQSRGVRSDWTLEGEYRCRGDMDLSEIPADKMLALCHTRREAEIIHDETGINTIPFVG